MIRPPFLLPGDTVGITAPAGSLSEPEILPSVELLRGWDLKVVYGEHLFRRHNSFAGTDLQRANDFQKMLDRPDIRAILCARGGYGSIRILDRLKFGRFLKQPKWIAGYSDITVLHAFLQQCLGTESIHGTMLRNGPSGEPDLVSLDSLRATLFGEIRQVALSPHKLNRTGTAGGVLLGGNLSVLQSIAGTCCEPEVAGKILFLEDVGEYLYHIDRMVMNLKLRGRLTHLKALIVGDMSGMKTSPSGFTKPAYRILRDAVAEYDYPVMFGFPAGHGKPNISFFLGREVTLEVTTDKCTLTY